jgi:hypothetical protein
MGYETKLIIGTVIDQKDKEGRQWFTADVELDLCKCGYDSNINGLHMRKGTDEKVYWYGLDGNTIFTKDRYDEEPVVYTIDQVINALEKDALESDYRRFKWALSLLSSIREAQQGEEFKVLLFGH